MWTECRYNSSHIDNSFRFITLTWNETSEPVKKRSPGLFYRFIRADLDGSCSKRASNLQLLTTCSVVQKSVFWMVQWFQTSPICHISFLLSHHGLRPAKYSHDRSYGGTSLTAICHSFMPSILILKVALRSENVSCYLAYGIHCNDVIVWNCENSRYVMSWEYTLQLA